MIRYAIVFPFLLITACSSSTNEDTTGLYFEFAHSDEPDYTFIAKTSDPEVIEKINDQLDLPFDERNLHIHGNISRGNAGYNQNWNWHFVPGQWDMVEISVEVCDGRPQMVEEDLDYWVDEVGYFCPWSSRVLRVVKPKPGPD